MAGPAPQRLATIWQLTWNENALACAVYRQGRELVLQVESPTAVVLAESFALRPRALARAQALRDSLKRRGWSDAPSPPPPGDL